MAQKLLIAVAIAIFAFWFKAELFFGHHHGGPNVTVCNFNANLTCVAGSSNGTIISPNCTCNNTGLINFSASLVTALSTATGCLLGNASYPPNANGIIECSGTLYSQITTLLNSGLFCGPTTGILNCIGGNISVLIAAVISNAGNPTAVLASINAFVASVFGCLIASY